MSDTPRKRPPADDDDYEVIDPPPAKPAPKRPVARAVAKPVAPPPEPDRFDNEDDDDSPPRKRKPVQKHWIERYIVNVRGLVLLAGLFLLIGGLAVVAFLFAPGDGAGQPAGRSAPDVPAPVRPAGGPKVPAGWQDYHDDAGGFDVWVPAGAAAEVVDTGKARLPAGVAPPRSVKWERDGRQYLATVNVMPGGPPGDADNGTLTNFLAGMKSTLPVRPNFGAAMMGRPTFQMVGGHRGIVATEALMDGRAIHIQATFYAGTAYALVVTSPAGTPAGDAGVAPFFDGFRFTPGAAKPSAAAPKSDAPPPARPAPRPAPPAKAADLGPPPAPTPPPDGWAEYADEQGAFTAHLPAGLTAAPEPVKEWQSASVKPRGLKWAGEAVTYYLIAVEEWPKPRPGAPAKTDAEADAANRSHLGWLHSYVDWSREFPRRGEVRPVWLAGRRAAADTRSPFGRAKADSKRVLHLRGLVADGTGYYLAVVGPKELAETAPEVAAFFDGFRLTAKP